MMQATIGDATTTWAQLRSGRVTGAGHVTPRLRFEIWARTPRERMEAHIQLLQTRLSAGGEMLGEGFATGIVLAHSDAQINVEIPVSVQALAHLDATVTGQKVDLSLQLSGFLRARDDNDDGPNFASRPDPGEWVYEPFGQRTTELLFQIARSDWFTDVLTPIGTLDYVSVEVALPRGDHPLRKTVDQLRQAERAYANGDDPTVFARCRAATEALPDAPMGIFSGISDRDEAETLDDLLKAANSYFHRGRHVAKEGARAGEFPVDHQDARFALNLAKLLVAQTARVRDRG